MWMLLLLVLPLAYLTWSILRAVPNKFRRLTPFSGWLLIIPAGIGAVAFFVKMQSLYSIMVIFGAMACYYIFRGAAFLGVAITYAAFDEAHPIKIPLIAPILGIGISLLEPALMITLFVLAYTIDFPAKLDTAGFPEIMFYAYAIMTFGLALSTAFLLIMYDKRKAVRAFGPSGTSPVANASRPASRPPTRRPGSTASFPAKPLSGKPWKGPPASTPPWKNSEQAAPPARDLPAHYLEKEPPPPQKPQIQGLEEWPDDPSE